MGKIKLSDAPGCIGSPLIRSENHPICKACAFRNICARLAVSNRDKLIAALGIPELSAVTGKKLMAGAEKMTIAELESPAFKDKKPLTVKGKEVMTGLRHVERDVLKDCLVGTKNRIERNHSLQSVQPDWSKDLIMLIGDNRGLVKKKDLRDYMENELGYPRLSAVSLVSAFINGMTNADFLTETANSVKVIDD